MTQITDNIAAWLPEAKAPAMKVGPGPIPSPLENEVVIKVAYAAVNPVDWKMQDHPYFPLKYPAIMGTDVSGTIAQLGSGVTRFKIGQRVIGHCDSLISLKAANSAFQRYTTCREILVAEVPDSVPLSKAAVLPLSVSTASAGLFKVLKLPFPTLDPEPTGKTVLIWGGSSSCGSSAIQLALATGWTVAATAGASNQDFVNSLGAAHVFDHKAPDVVDQILKILKPGDLVLDCIGEAATLKPCSEVVSKLGGGTLASVLPPMGFEYDNVNIVPVNGLDPGLVDLDIGDAVWRKYVPQALAAGKFQAKPEALIVEGGLEHVQEGINILRRGVSAKKVVIEVARAA